MFHLKGVEVPDYDVSLETHMSLLTRGDIFSSFTNFYHRNVVIVTPEKLLGS